MELVSADRVGQRRVDQREVESVDQVLSWLDGVGLCAEQVSWSGGELISSWSKILSLKITTQM